MAIEKFFHIQQMHDVTIMSLISEDEVDRLMMNDLQRAIIAFVEQERPLKLLVDFAGVRRFSSETISALIRARRRLTEYHGQISLCAMRPEVREVFRLMRLEGTVFDIVTSREDGLQLLQDSA